MNGKDRHGAKPGNPRVAGDGELPKTPDAPSADGAKVPNSILDFRPIRIKGELLSTTILRERR